MEFSWARKAVSISISGLFITFIANILSNGETVNAANFDSANFFWATIVGVSIIALGLFMDTSDFVYDLFIWRKYITPKKFEKEKPYISAIVSNKNGQQKSFFCVLKSISYNGKENKELTKRIIEHTSRISWSGGASEGMKIIDGKHEGTLNIISVTNGKLAFEMATGILIPDCPSGNYNIDLEINRQSKESNFRKNKFSVSFDYYFQSDGTAKIHLFEK